MKIHFVLTLFLISITSTITIAHAERSDTGFYAGVGVSQNYFDVDDLEDDLEGIAGPPFSADIDDDDTGFKVFAGYNFVKNFGFEIGYHDLGSLDGEVNATGAAVDLATTEVDDIQAFSAKLIGRYQVSNYDFFASAGIAFIEADAEIVVDPSGLAGGPLVASDDFDDEVFKFGAGATWYSQSGFGIRGEWEYFDEFEDVSTNSFTLGILYNF